MKKEYEVGQIWEYKTRDGEETSRITIVNITEHEHHGSIISIYINGLKIKYPFNELGYLNEMTHSPCSKNSIDISVTRLVETTSILPDFKEGFNEWKEQFDLGKAGVFGGSIKEIIETLEQSVNT